MSNRRELSYVLSAMIRLVQSRNALFVICAFLVSVIILVGFWPFNFFPSNGANWLGHEKGLRFSHYGIAYSKDSLFLSPLGSSTESAHPISIEILLKPYEEIDGYVALIVLLSHGLHEAPLRTIGQWRSFFLVRTPRQTNRADGKVDEIDVRDALRSGEQRFVALTAGPRGEAIYVDGVRAETFPSHRWLPHPNGKTSFRVVVGNDTAGKSPWHGEVLGLAIYERELRPEDVRLHHAHWQEGNYAALVGEPGVIGVYTFDEGSGPWAHNRVADSGHLWIPERFRPLEGEVLATPGRGFKVEWYFVEDVIINILGFVPLGYFLMDHPEMRGTNSPWEVPSRCNTRRASSRKVAG